MEIKKVTHFLVKDAGETEIVLSILPSLKFPFKILSYGTSQKLLDKANIAYNSLEEVLGIPKIVDSHPRSAPLAINNSKLLGLFQDSRLLVSGVASYIQGQLMIAAQMVGVPTIAIWDNMKGDDTGEYWKVAQSVQFNANFVIYPSFTTLFEMPILPKKYSVLGNPTLEGWAQEIKNIDFATVKNALDCEKQLILTYIAGWNGDPQCAAGTTFFAKCIRNLPQDFKVLIQTHPRSEPEKLEKPLFQKYKNVVISKISTIEAVAVSDLVMLHKSTAGSKAAAAGRRLLYVVEEQDYSNPLVEWKLAEIVRKEEQFETKLEIGLSKSATEMKEGVYKAYKIPFGGKENIASFLQYY